MPITPSWARRSLKRSPRSDFATSTACVDTACISSSDFAYARRDGAVPSVGTFGSSVQGWTTTAGLSARMISPGPLPPRRSKPLIWS